MTTALAIRCTFCGGDCYGGRFVCIRCLNAGRLDEPKTANLEAMPKLKPERGELLSGQETCPSPCRLGCKGCHGNHHWREESRDEIYCAWVCRNCGARASFWFVMADDGAEVGT